MAEGRPGCDRHGHRLEEGSLARRHDRRPGGGCGAVDAYRGLVPVLEPRKHRRRHACGVQPADGTKLFRKEGKLDQIRAAAAPGTSQAELIKEIDPILPPDTQVRSGAGQATEDASDTKAGISFLQNFLLAFGGIALFVGAFVIANSLSITIAQRTREFATVRTIGASRRQILRAVSSSRS